MRGQKVKIFGKGLKLAKTLSKTLFTVEQWKPFSHIYGIFIFSTMIMIMINRYYTIFKTLETNSRGLKITSQCITRAKGYGVGENKNKYCKSLIFSVPYI